MNYFYFLLLIIIKFSSCTLLFKLKDTEPQCLGGDYSGTAIVFVKYKIFTPSRQNLNNILPYINIMKDSIFFAKKLDTFHFHFNYLKT